MKKINKTTMMIFALVLSLSVVIGTSLAYFSDYEEAAGAATLSLGGQTKLYEGEDTDKKEIVVTNTGKTEMIVRVAVFGPDEMFSNSNPSYNSADWEKVGNYYYYKHVLKPDPEGKGKSDQKIRPEKEEACAGPLLSAFISFDHCGYPPADGLLLLRDSGSRFSV